MKKQFNRMRQLANQTVGRLVFIKNMHCCKLMSRIYIVAGRHRSCFHGLTVICGVLSVAFLCFQYLATCEIVGKVMFKFRLCNVKKKEKLNQPTCHVHLDFFLGISAQIHEFKKLNYFLRCE